MPYPAFTNCSGGVTCIPVAKAMRSMYFSFKCRPWPSPY